VGLVRVPWPPFARFAHGTRISHEHFATTSRSIGDAVVATDPQVESLAIDDSAAPIRAFHFGALVGVVLA
jgi:hypothetical protein